MTVKEILNEAKKALKHYQQVKVGMLYSKLSMLNVYDGLCHFVDYEEYTKLNRILQTYLRNKNVGDFEYLWPVIKRHSNYLSKYEYDRCIAPRMEWLQDVIDACEYLLDNDKTKYVLL